MKQQGKLELKPMKLIIPCLDVRRGKVTKGIRFQDNVDLGDPVEMAAAYSAAGCDELVLYDITASAERRSIDLNLIKAVAQASSVPLAVGGGISGPADMAAAIAAGAAKVSLNSAAVKNPKIIAEGARSFGAARIVLGMDPIKTNDLVNFPSGYAITIRGFRERTELDALAWALQAQDLGAGEIVVNSVDADGTQAGYELPLTQLIAAQVRVPVIASGGAGKPEDLVAVFKQTGAAGAIVASMVHSGAYSIGQIKAALAAAGLQVRQ